MDLRKAAEDEIGEIFSNGEPINWNYWASLKTIEPRQAAILAHSIDPIKWEDGTFENGQWPDSLKTKIQYLHVWLSDRADSYTLPSLVAALGEGSTPCGMKEAIQVRKVDATQQAAPAAQDGQNSANWKDQVREIADELDAKDKANGVESSVRDMSGRVARTAIDRGIKGPQGQLTAGNILREALQGGRWSRRHRKP